MVDTFDCVEPSQKLLVVAQNTSISYGAEILVYVCDVSSSTVELRSADDHDRLQTVLDRFKKVWFSRECHRLPATTFVDT